MQRLAFAIAALVATGPAFAQEPVGCDKFKWPLDKERAMLTSADTIKISSGAEIAAPMTQAATLALAPAAEAKMPMKPERTPKSPDTFAGFARLAAMPQAGEIKITLSSEGWIDVIQDGAFVKSGPFSGAMGCEGIRKSVRFNVAASQITLQISAVRAPSINFVVTPGQD